MWLVRAFSDQTCSICLDHVLIHRSAVVPNTMLCFNTSLVYVLCIMFISHENKHLKTKWWQKRFTQSYGMCATKLKCDVLRLFLIMMWENHKSIITILNFKYNEHRNDKSFLEGSRVIKSVTMMMNVLHSLLSTTNAFFVATVYGPPWIHFQTIPTTSFWSTSPTCTEQVSLTNSWIFLDFRFEYDRLRSTAFLSHQ